MDIFWLGHSCFRLRGREATIVTDPYDRSLGYPPLRLSADIVTVSQAHPHHDHVAAVGGNPKVVAGPGEYEIAGVMITGVDTRREKRKPGPARNTAYVIEVDDVTICHLGDLAHLLATEQIEALKDADVLLIPVGGQDTIGASEAVEVVAQLEPRLVVPMHYQTEAVKGLGLDPVDRFCREMGATNVAPQPKLSVARTTLPEETQVVLLDYRRA